MAAVVSGCLTVAAWAYYAVVNPTVGAAVVAGVASIANTMILVRHERHVDRRLDERRNVIVRGTPEDADAVLVTSEEVGERRNVIVREERRQLEDRRAKPETRKERERRYRDRRK